MNIENYTAYFHDGELIDIIQKNDCIEFSLISSELPEGIYCDLPLSLDHTIRGKLVAKKIKRVLVNEIVIVTPLKMQFDDGDIFDFEIKRNTVKFTIIWSNFRPKKMEMTTNTIQVDADAIEWIPSVNLANPLERIEPPPQAVVVIAWVLIVIC